MQVEKGNIWDYHKNGYTIVITTNAKTNINGEAIMGKGLALQAKVRYPELSRQLGELLQIYNNHVFYFQEYDLFTFPTKDDWRDKSTLDLIKRSAHELKLQINSLRSDELELKVAIPKVGTQNGGLTWVEVLPVLESELEEVDNLVLVDND